MKKSIFTLLFVGTIFFLVFNTQSSVVFAQKTTICRTYYAAKKTPPKKGCNECARLKKIETEIAEMQNKIENQKPGERNPEDHSKLMKLIEDFDALVEKVRKIEEEEIPRLDKRIDDQKTDFESKLAELTSVTTTKITETNTRIDKVEDRTTALENQCNVKEVLDDKGKKHYINCKNEEVVFKKGYGWVKPTLIIVGGATATACIFGWGGFCRSGKKALPPGVTTVQIP